MSETKVTCNPIIGKKLLGFEASLGYRAKSSRTRWLQSETCFRSAPALGKDGDWQGMNQKFFEEKNISTLIKIKAINHKNHEEITAAPNIPRVYVGH